MTTTGLTAGAPGKTGAPPSVPHAMLWPVETQFVSPVFVGRTEELQALKDALARADAGEPQALLLGGEAGVGKTRLVEEFAQHAVRAGAVVALGGCVEIGADGLPYAPFSTALRALRHELPAELADAAQGQEEDLARLLPEVDWRGAALGNHSGLDGTARLTPRQLAAIVRYGWQNDALPALLPGGGWSGTLIHRFDGAGEALRVWAKTGTLNYGSALAGYLFPMTDRPAVFVTMVADTGARDAYDALLPYPGPGARAAAGAWLSRASALQDALVESWLQPMPTS